MPHALRRLLHLTTVAICAAMPVVTWAQATQDARLVVTVVDPAGAVLQGAEVIVLALGDAAKATPLANVRTTDKGVAILTRLVPGRYTIEARFEGLETGVIPEISLSAGETRRVIALSLKSVEESVSVGGGQEDAAARSPSTFGLQLTSDQVEALSDDPMEMQRQLDELGGLNTIIRVDSFEGQQLPPKAQIKSIHVTRDQFAAETEQPGATFVDVITQAGVGALRGGANYSFRDGRTDGRNPFLAPGARTPSQFSNYGFNLGGTLIRDHADFSISLTRNANYNNPIHSANAITGAPSMVMARRQSTDIRNIDGLLNYALTRDQTVRLSFSRRSASFTSGFGGYDDPERAYTAEASTYSVRVMEAGPIGRRTFVNSRLSVNWDRSRQHSLTEQPTIAVVDTVTMGGAQVAGGTRSRNFTIESDIDHVRGIHSWRGGIKLVGGSFRTDERYNYLGTYTFSSVDDYLAGRPALYTIETGNPAFSYTNLQGAIYLQDDIRVSKGLTLSPGVRYSAQSRIHDPGAFEPRFGLTWAPVKSGRTTIRASAGSFHGWLATNVLAQAIRLDGTHQRQVVIRDPSYPDPGSEGVVTPPNRYLIGDYQLNQNVRYSAGIDQVLSSSVRVSVVYAYWHMRQLPRGENLNPIVNGVRADPAFANVIATVTDAEIRRHDLNATFNINLAPAGGGAGTRFNWRRLVLNGAYGVQLPKRSGIGPFDVPPSGTLANEWGRGPMHRRYLVNANITSTQIRNLSVNVNVQVIDGYVYHQTTGTDDNGDGLLNDRLPGVGLWSLRADGQETVNLRVQYNLSLGTRGGPPARYRIAPFVQINNLTNHANYGGYSGVLSSPNYGKPTMVVNPRAINIGMNLAF